MHTPSLIVPKPRRFAHELLSTSRPSQSDQEVYRKTNEADADHGRPTTKGSTAYSVSIPSSKSERRRTTVKPDDVLPAAR